ncbi:hypothetical protein V6N11_019366 [Hibiscus sabdariffa]|uniref:Uncharacterized protein n=1 Tax=Hibiscus sabdariffa TaxID=183260 RepID=A0ABR2R271_9ROSI
MPGFQPLLVVLQLALETERHSNISIEVEYVPHLVGKEVLDLQTRSCGNIGRDGQHLRKVHGILNIIGWGTSLPIGVIVARMIYITPESCQTSAALSSITRLLTTLGCFVCISMLVWREGLQLKYTRQVDKKVLMFFKSAP